MSGYSNVRPLGYLSDEVLSDCLSIALRIGRRMLPVWRALGYNAPTPIEEVLIEYVTRHKRGRRA